MCVYVCVCVRVCVRLCACVCVCCRFSCAGRSVWFGLAWAPGQSTLRSVVGFSDVGSVVFVDFEFAGCLEFFFWIE